MYRGFITLHRKMTQWEWYTDNPTKSLFIHLLLTANHEDKKWRGQLIKRGQLITSLQHLSDETGLTVQQVRRAVKNLRLTDEITTTTTNKWTLITVEKYSDYQDKPEEENKQTTGKRTNGEQTKNKQRTTNNNVNNVNHVEQVKEKHNKKKDELEEIVEQQPEPLQEPIRDFMENRKAMKDPMRTKRALNMFINRLMDLSGGDIKEAIRLIDIALMNNWKTVYILDDGKKKKERPRNEVLEMIQEGVFDD